MALTDVGPAAFKMWLIIIYDEEIWLLFDL